VTLQEVDGGSDYWSQFPNPVDGGDPSFIPLAGWFRPAESQAQIDAYKAFGMNTFAAIECPECARLDLVRANGLKAFIYAQERTRFSGIGSETVGWMLNDEQDMCCGPPGFAGGNGFTNLSNQDAGLPDNRARFVNYGKGAAMWESDSDAAKWFNGSWNDASSMDVYWMTDPNESGNSLFRLPYGYGWNVERQRYLDGTDGTHEPQLGIVETGAPFTESFSQGTRRILPAEARAAVWQSFIAGARGIVYFDHNFSPDACGGSTIRDECYDDTHDALASTNAQIKSLGSVLNSPSVVSGTATGPGIAARYKWDGQHFYVLAGNRDNTARTVSMGLPCVGDATAVKLGEGGESIPVTAGKFSDLFADKNAAHIYRIDGGSTCGL
jgi:hypothetical protein